MNHPFKKIGLVARHSKPEVVTSLLALADYLVRQGLSIFIDCESVSVEESQGHPLITRHAFGKAIDVAIVLGGDGTMLSIARLVAPHRIPLIGINQGRLGFMTDIPLHEMQERVHTILQGDYIAEERRLVSATLQRAEQDIASHLALNDIVFNRGATGSMIEFEVFIDQQFVYSQRSDGLIISTPTGSTAYALAAGGPILHPTLPAITLVPICPQSLSNRPIAVNDTSTIDVVLTRGVDAKVHFDGQAHCDLHEVDRVVIRRYPHPLKILHPQGYNYYDMLRHKLHWGERLL